MAEERDEDLELAPADAGAAFRAEMAATNLLMGYWKPMLAGLLAVLMSFLVWGQYAKFVQRAQRATAAQIAEVERDLPLPIAAMVFQKAQGGLAVAPDVLIEAAERMEAVAGASSGTGSVEASLKAAEIYRLADATDKRRVALEAAAGESEGLLQYAAQSALASLDLESGNGEGAIRRYELLQEGDGFLARRATIDLGLALEHLGRRDEAATVFDTFLSRWPDAPGASQVRAHRDRVGSAG